MPAKTINFDRIKHQTSNVYEAVVAMSARAKQLNEQYRQDIDEKLSPFKMKTRNPVSENEADKVFPEQVAISVKFEKMPKATITSIEEYMDKKFTYDYNEHARRKNP